MDLKGGRGKERVFGERNGESISGSSSRTDSKKVMVDNYGNNVREGVKGLRFEQRGAAIETEFVEKLTRISQFPTDNWISGDEIEMNVSRCMSVVSSVEDISAHLKNFAGSVRSRESMDQFRGVERDRFYGFYASPMVGAQRGRMPTSAYPDEGPSTYKVDSFDGTSEVENLEQDRAELLRKLDELKEKLSRSYDVADKPREPVPMERSRTPPDPYGNLLTYTLSMQPYAVDEQMTKPPHFNYSHGTVTFTEHRNMVMQQKNLYPPQGHPWNAIPENKDPSQQQMKRRPSHHPLQYPRPPPNETFLGQRMEFNANPYENASHSPACSCSVCYNPNWVAPPQVPLDDFGNQRVPKAPINLNSNHHVNPVIFLPHDYNPRHASPPPLHTRWQSDFDSEPRTAMAINRRAQIFHPVAGGAPFITCFRCFEILKLPRKLKNMNKNQSKLQCGSCSTVISLEIKNKKLFTSKDSKRQSSEFGQSSNEALKGSVLSPRGSPNEGDTKSPCDDLDHSDHTSPFIDTEDNLLTEDQKLDVDESAKGRKKQDRPKIGKGAVSLLVGLIKKSSRDISKSNQAVEKTRPTVFINGQPIPDHVVRKAEKLAGPIRPGDYWYDFRAGFWGVMGQACLGIIPPFIEEFNYPIPTNCAAGNTGVYVNGRELHPRDLDLLARRGLPTTREKFYIVEMSGRVVDEDSGEDLKSLGKLAPTIEKAKLGFGMKVPRMAV